MRPVEHLAVDADSASAGFRGKGRHHHLCFLDLLRAGREHLVDHRDLRRVNGQTPGEAVAPRFGGVAAQAFGVAEVDIDGLDRRKLCRRRAVEADVAGQAIGLGEQALFVAVGFGAEFGGQILRPPGHADQPLADVTIRAGGE